MDKHARKTSKGGKKKEEVGESQQKLTGRAGVLKVKRNFPAKSEVPIRQPDFEDGGDAYECPLGELPKKLFASDSIPTQGRLNIVSRIDRLSELVKIMHGSSELEWIKESVFGKLFTIPTRYCEFSGRLVHNMLCRALVTERKHEMWFIFGGKPLCFSLKEFAMITGLNCNPLPSKEEIKRLQTPEEGDEPYWNTLFGKLKTMTIDGIVRILRNDKMEPPHNRMDSDKRLKLALIVIVEGILCVRSSAIAATPNTVEMVKDLESFCDYPWGRESFELTMRMVSVGEKVRSLESLAGKLYQSHISNHGFTLAYQLLAIYTIPLLEKIIPVKDFDSFFDDPKFQGLARSKPFHNDNILAAENNPELIVESLLSTGHSVDDWDLSWEDEVDDPKVARIYKGLETDYNFTPSDWKVLQVRPIHRHPRARGKPQVDPETWTGMACGDSARYEADRIVLEGDKIMDGYFARKHDFEFKEEQNLRDGVRNLLIKALTMRDNYEGNKVVDEETVDEDLKPLRTPMRRVRGASDLESSASGEEKEIQQGSGEKPKQKSRKRKGKGRKGKAPREEKTTEISDSEKGESVRTRKKTKFTEDFEGHESGGSKDKDPVGASISGVVADVNRKFPEEEVHRESIDHQTDVINRTEPHDAMDQPRNIPEKVTIPEIRDEHLIEPKAHHNPAPETVNVKSPPKATTEIDMEELGASNEPAMPAFEKTEDVAKTVLEVDVDGKQEVSSPEKNDDDMDGAENSEGVGGNEELGEHSRGLNYCSGYEDDDDIDEAAIAANQGQAPNVDQGATATTMPRVSTRTRGAPTRFGQTPEEKETPKSEESEPEEYDPLRSVSEVKKKALMRALDNRKKVFKVLGQEVKKTFFRELYKPRQHVSTAHMEAMLASVWAKRGMDMLDKKGGIMNAWFVQHLVQEHGRYKKHRNPPVPFRWNSAIVNYVDGSLDNREGSMRWMVDVDHLYALMNWNNQHWVTLNISLMMGAINILDCNQNLTLDPKMPKLMSAVVEILPLILRDLVDPALEAADSFDYVRGIGVSQNERAGDCGPLTVKFIELDAQGHSVEGITDKDVDALRMNYAIDVYEHNHEPL